MARHIDLAGQTFGMLTVVERSGTTKNGRALWLCQCSCGNTTLANGTSLRRGEIVSCGCLGSDQIKHARELLDNQYTIDGAKIPLLTKKVRSDSRTGHKGVSSRKRKGNTYYEANITIKGKRHYLGTFKDINLAIEARREAEETYHKPYIDESKKGTKKAPTT